MATSTRQRQSKWDRMAEDLFVTFRGDRLRETSHSDYPKTLVLSESIVVNGNTFIPANTTLTIEKPADQN